MRVLHVLLSLRQGGAERMVVELIRSLPKQFHSAVCCLDAAGDLESELESHGIEIRVLGRKPGFSPRIGLRLARLARELDVEVLHCHQYTPFVYGSIAALINPSLKVVFTEHGRLSDAPPSRKRWMANQFFGRLPAKIFAVCEDLRRFMLVEGFPGERVEVIYNGIEPGNAPGASERSESRRRLGVGDQAYVVGTVSRLDPVKQLETLVGAFATLRPSQPGSSLVIVGDGEERQRLDRIVHESGLDDVVHFTGSVPDARRLLPGFDLYVNCSTQEGISVSIAEAMAAALPVVATRVGGTPELVEEGVTGLLVEPGRPEALAAAMARLASEPGLSRDMGEKGRARVEERFSLEQMTQAYVHSYLD